MILNINQLAIDVKFQNRAALDPDVVRDYADLMSEGINFPSVKVYFDSVKYYLVDGYHRYYAYLKARIFDIECDIVNGTERDAILYACGVNSTHGLKRTNADKRKAVMTLLNDEEWKEYSDFRIAEICKVHINTVSNIRKENDTTTNCVSMDSEPEARTFIHHKTGKPTQMNVSNIGKKKIEPVSDIEEPEEAEEYEPEIDTELAKLKKDAFVLFNTYKNSNSYTCRLAAITMIEYFNKL